MHSLTNTLGSLTRMTKANSSAALLAITAGLTLPASDANAAWVDATSWTINVSADPIGCPGAATVTASFRFRKTAFGGPLGAGTLNVGLWDADAGGIFDPDDHIGQATVTWAAQNTNFVDLTVTFDVECVETDNGWCTIRGNAGTDDEGDPHEMYIYVEQPNSGAFWNNSWTSPKNLGGWLKYTFPLRCGCDQNAGEGVEYDIAWTQSGQSSSVVTFDLPQAGEVGAPLEFFQGYFRTDLEQLDLVDVIPLVNGGRTTDVFGQPQVEPGPDGFFVGLPVIDPQAAQQLDTMGLEIIMQQIDPLGFSGARIAHDPNDTRAVFGNGAQFGFQPVDGEIPVRPIDEVPPQIEIEMIQLDLVSPQPFMQGQPGSVTDNVQLPLQDPVDLELTIFDENGNLIYVAEKPTGPNGAFDFLLPQLGEAVLGGQAILKATDQSGNTAGVGIPLIQPCNDADLAAPFGILDLNDLNTFISAFMLGLPQADINGDGIVDLSDVNAFISAFTAGCP